MSIQVEQGGLLTTVQDRGRRGWQQYGVPVAGAMDQQAMMLANLLVDNDESEAVLEATVLGPALRFQTANVFAVTGGDLSPQLNGQVIPMYRAVAAGAGDKLTFGGLKTGFRAYIAFAGGLDVPLVMNSRSTHLRGKFGGYEGRRLMPGDEIGFAAPRPTLPNLPARRCDPEEIPGAELWLRVIRGPQDKAFTPKGLDTFFSSEYTITNECDRTGAKLEGSGIEHVKDGNIISDGIAFGSVQVPSNGQPIIMLADRLPTGGYTKIATVISVDIPRLAQSKPGTKIRFREVSVQQAQDLYVQAMGRRQELAQRIRGAAVAADVRRFLVRLEGREYQVSVERCE